MRRVIKPQTIPIEEVVNSRVPLPQSDTDSLRESLTKGQKQPLILDAHMNLIDGARRLELMRKLGKTKVSVVVTETLEDTCYWLYRGLVRKDGEPAISARRVAEIFQATQLQQKERSRILRQRRVGVPRDEPLAVMPRSRQMLCEAFGFEGESFLAISTLLYKRFSTNTNPARAREIAEIQRRLEADEVTLYEAKGLMERLGQSDMSGDILTANDQRDALATAVSQLSGVTKGVARIGEVNPKISQVELGLYLRGFEEGRRNLQRFINSLRKRITE